MADADSDLRKKIIAIQRNPDLTPQEKAKQCQALMNPMGAAAQAKSGEQLEACYGTRETVQWMPEADRIHMLYRFCSFARLHASPAHLSSALPPPHLTCDPVFFRRGGRKGRQPGGQAGKPAGRRGAQVHNLPVRL